MSGLMLDDFRRVKRGEVAGYSGIGRREEQQDVGYITVNDSELLAFVCDGMGGMNGGSLASATAAKMFLNCCVEGAARGGPCLREAAEAADDAVYHLRNKQGERMGCGTTLTAVRVDNKALTWVSVGDSRAYLLRGEELVQITTDHNYFLELNQALERGNIDEKKYRAEAVSGEALISFLGVGGLPLIDVSKEPFPLFPGDILLLCTDGVYRTLSNQTLRQLLRTAQNMEQACMDIADAIEYANQEHQDNYTYILIQIL